MRPDDPVCPTCGHPRSAWIGGGCTAFVPLTEEQQQRLGRWVGECGHDCSVDHLGESLHEKVRRSLAQRPSGDGPAADAEALAQDWRNVGGDMQRAMRSLLARELETRPVSDNGPTLDELRRASAEQALEPYRRRLSEIEAEIGSTWRGRLALKLAHWWARRRK